MKIPPEFENDKLLSSISEVINCQDIKTRRKKWPDPRDQKKDTQNVNFEWIIGPNDPFRLFSHYILCPIGPTKEENAI